MAKKKVGGRFGISPHSHLSPMATEALTPSMISDLLATLDACWPEQRSVPEYHPDFPGPQGEPCQVICPPPPPPSPPSFQLCDQPTATLFLGNLHYKMTEDRLVTFIHYFLRRVCALPYVRVFPNSDGRTAWALVSFPSVTEACQAQRALQRQALDKHILRVQYAQ